MREILFRFLMLWLAIFVGLVIISFLLNWSLFVQYFNMMMGQLILSIVLIVILVGAIIYMISAMFRR